MTLDPFLATCASPATASSYRDRLSTFTRWLGERPPTKAALAAYFEYLLKERKVSNRTALLYRATLAAYFDWQMRETGRPKENPVPVLKLPCRESTRQAFTAQEIGRILSACDKAEWYWAPAVVVGMNTGLRLGDISTLTWPDVDFDKHVIVRVPNKTRRFGKVCEIPMLSEVEAALSRVRLSHQEPIFVFPSMSTLYRWNPAQLSGQFAAVCKRASVDPGFHRLRHFFVSTLVDGGASHIVIGAMSGHGLKTIQRYAHPSLATKMKALLTLSNDEPRTSVKL